MGGGRIPSCKSELKHRIRVNLDSGHSEFKDRASRLDTPRDDILLFPNHNRLA